MAQPIWRFANAADLRLDLPLRGMGRLPDSQRRIAEDAPAAAWERIVEVCIGCNVEFLLLTPRTSAGRLSLGDRRALRNGFRQLEDFGIRVYWALAGDETQTLDLHDSWPENVTLLAQPGDAATFVREGRLLACLTFGSVRAAAGAPVASAATASTGTRPLRIVIPTEPGALDRLPARDADAASPSVAADAGDADYVAGWGSSRWQSRRNSSALWLDPGSPQSRTADEGAGGGVGVIEWDGGQICDVQQAPASTVHRERHVRTVEPETTRDEFAEWMQFALLEREPAIGEQLWIVDWAVVGSGPLFDSLHSESVQRDLERAADAAAGGGDRLARVHRWDLRPGGTGDSDGLVLQVQQWLAQHGEADWPIVGRELESELLSNNFSHAADCLKRVNPAAVREAAEHRIETWLCGAGRESA